MVPELLGIIAPVFVCVLLGFAWRRAGRSYPTEFVTDLVTNLGAPSLVFSSLISFRVDVSLMTELMAAAALAVAVFGGLGALVLAAMRLPRTNLLAPLMFPNAGNLALPLSLFAFGPEGLALATSVFAMVAILHFTLGIWIWTGSVSLRALFTSPVAWATLLALGVILSGVTLPLWI
ncbi:MAG: AEC family transporter, partial [Myxococcota bacterium]|nr:AEC family transporter [Myxococcota bacterium]